MRKQFRAPWDFLLGAITGVITLFLIGMMIFAGSDFVLIISLIIIGGAAAFGVYGYSIQNGELRILRLGWSTKINLKYIDKVEFNPNAILGSIRTFGSGGLFGYYGHFSNGRRCRFRSFIRLFCYIRTTYLDYYRLSTKCHNPISNK